MKRYIPLFFVFLLLFSACEKEEPELNIDKGQENIPAEGGSLTVTVSSNYGWTASSADPWITVNPTSGQKGTATVSVSVAANSGSMSRRGSVTFTCEGLTRSVSISQAQPLNQKLTIVHSASVFTVPTINGNGMTAKVNFGEGTTQSYVAGAKWTYSSTGSHKVVIESAGGTSFTMETVAGVSEIDMSEF